MARVEGLDIGAPSILGDSLGMIERPRKEKKMEVAQVPPELQTEIERRAPAAPAMPAAPQAPSPGDLVRERERVKMQREEAQRAASAAKKGALERRKAEITAEFAPRLNAPAPTFESPRESFSELGSLAAMMMVMGTMAGGKGVASATGAMNAMAGMLQGYQAGRKDAFDRAKAEYERNYREWQRNKKAVADAFNRAIKMAPQDIQGATNRAVAELSANGANTLASAVKTQGLVSTANMFNEASDKADKQIESLNDTIRRMSGVQPTETGVQIAGELPRGTPLTIEELRRRERELDTEMKAQAADKRAAPRGSLDPQFIVVEGFNNNQPFRATREERDRINAAGFQFSYQTPRGRERSVSVVDPNNPKKSILVTESEVTKAASEGRPYTPAPRTGTSGPGGAVQFRYNQAVSNATEVGGNDMENYASSPLMASPPIADEVLTNPSKGLTEAAKAFFSQKITPAEDRAVQQNIVGLVRAAANIQAGGRPGGVTESALRELNKLAPRAGDAKINSFLFLAMMKQEFSIAVKDLKAAGATDNQIALAEANKKRVDELIPWTVQDINRILRSGGPALVSPKTIELINLSNTRKEFEKGVRTKQSTATPQYKSEDEVADAYDAGEIDQETALRILREQFGKK